MLSYIIPIGILLYDITIYHIYLGINIYMLLFLYGLYIGFGFSIWSANLYMSYKERYNYEN